MDTELFMECEEEELEPWQQVDDSVEEEDMVFMDDYCEPVDSLSPLPASEAPPSQTPSITPAPTAVSTSVMSPPPPPPPITSSVSQIPAVSLAPPRLAQATPLILTQTAGGTFLLPTAPGSGTAPPFLFTAQGFPVMNHCAPLLLNLQPGQTVRPLTLIQSPSLGQLVRPSVGVSPALPQGPAVPASARGPAQPGSTFTAMQLPATLTIRTSTPGSVNIQMTQMGGANSFKLAGSPALPSGSANGVTRITSVMSPASGPAPSVIAMPSVTSPPPSDPPRVVMSVEEFYYGTFEGDLSLRKPPPLGIKTSSFSCQICSHLTENNLRLMQHMLQHSELTGGGGGGKGDERRCCRFCYRQLSTPSQLQTHQEQVHGPDHSSCMCRICEWAFENEPVFLTHMKSNHKPGEMPYVCQVCSYRSSFYSDVLQHFASFHRDSQFLLCVFCLKVTRNPATYQQHLLRHQINQAFHCNRCRLQFVFLKDKMQHKLENHRSFRRPAQLEGLPPGSKVTIRTYGKVRPSMVSTGGRLLQNPSSLIQPIVIKTEHRRPSLSKVPRKPISRRTNVVRRSSQDGDHRLVCLECGTDASNFSAHYPTHVHCLLCPYSSCCSRAYAAHMIHHHVPQCKENVVPLHRLPPPCVFLLQCSDCDVAPQTADQMADHLLENPGHHSATCRPRIYVEPDIKFYLNEEQPHSEEREPAHFKDSPDAPWGTAESWKHPADSDGATSSIVSFTQTSGPRHHLSKNSDAIDFFNLLFPAALMELIANETNAHAKTCHYLGSGCPGWAPVSTNEVKAFIGLVILIGTHNLSDLSHYWSWCNYDNSYTFCRAMSFERFKQIATNIRMGSFTTDEHRGTSKSGDPLHIFRPMLGILGGAMWNAYQPNCSLAIDRALLPSLEKERVKGGPKAQPQMWLLCDSKSGYCHRLFIQVGEQVGRETGFTVVPELVKGLEGKHHHLYLANSLTSVPLMQKLLDQGIYASSSFPPPNTILPKELWDEGSLEKPGDYIQRKFGPLLATRWRDTKEMGCLSTNAAPGEQDTVWRRSQTKVGELDPINRPMAFRLLQENMRGVDICKQLLACNPLGGIPHDRHWRSLFWFLVNVSIVNAFIMLRESRKDNPPLWVRGGLFTQANFRKCLGNQLAKCAQKYFETVEIAGPRGMSSGVAEEPVKQRHRMVKITGLPKRCKNCNLKNVRHESVYGCAICQVNICKQPSCFWEYHGLPPRTRASTKIGFLKDRLSGEIELKNVEDDVDGAMAPIEDMDFSDDEGLDNPDGTDGNDEYIKEKHVKEENSPVSHLPKNGHTQSAAVLSASKDRDDFLTARQLRIILLALCDGLHQASRVFSTDAQLIWSWQKEARKRLKHTKREQKADGSDHMVAWILSMREQQLPITENSLFNTASALKKNGLFSDNFRISYNWAVNLMLRHRLGVRSIGREATLARRLPLSLQDEIKSFREFTQRVIQIKTLPGDTVAAMDELCLFVDTSSVQDKTRCSEALELTGSLPLVTVYLAVLSDGTMLPSLVLGNRQLPLKALPEFIVVAAGPETLSRREALDLWANSVWLPHVSSLTQPSKSMLVLDQYREHLEESFVTSISGSGTLPVAIPRGCSFCLQPLEVCMKPVLQQFLLSRWAKFTAGNPKELEETLPHQLQATVTQLLIDWVVEALTLMNNLSQLWKKSFQLTGLLPGQQEVVEKPENIQSDLLKTLTETLLGAEALEASPPEQPEDEEDTVEKQGEGEEKQKDEEEEREVEMKREETENETWENRKEREDKGKETEEASSPSNVETYGDDTVKDKVEKDIRETEDRKDEEGEEIKRIEQLSKLGFGKPEEKSGGGEEAKEDRKDIIKLEEESGEGEEDRKEEIKKLEEEKKAEEDRKEMNKERRETRIVIGKDVGDEWKITVKSRTDRGDDKMDES